MEGLDRGSVHFQKTPMNEPLISAIIISPDGFQGVRRLVECLRIQDEARVVELVFVFPRGCDSAVPDHIAESFAGCRLVEIDEMDSTARARAAGVRAAGAPLVLMTEEHSLPEPGAIKAFLEAHRENRAVVGPAIVNGNPDSLMSWANLVIEYGEWLDPTPGAPARHLPGHNSCYRRDVLLSYGSELDKWLEAESVLHWDLLRRGYALWLEPKAKTRHHNFSLSGASLRLRYLAGRHFAGMCRLRWPRAKSLLYAAASPLIPLVRLGRIIRQLARPGRPRHLLPALVPLCLALLAVETAGAAVGYLFGAGDSSTKITGIDFHRIRYMKESERWRLT